MIRPPQAILVIDLAFGDCGKGTTVDFFVRHYHAHTVVRFNGGPQAGHNVVTAAGLHHTFSQFGSGTLVPSVRTLLSHFVLIEPYAMFKEEAHLQSLGIRDAFDRLMVDARCPVITPSQQAANRIRELARGTAAHGTCGMGIGQTMQDLADHPDLIVRAADLSHRRTIAAKLRAINALKRDELRESIRALDGHPHATFSIQTLTQPTWIEAATDNYAELALRTSIVDDSAVAAIFRSPGAMIFEGAQGVLLDETFGFPPHTTWSNTTFANAQQLLDESRYTGQRTRVGVLRTYFTRHGPGPMVTEDPGLEPLLPEPHNSNAGWQGKFRVGLFDAVAARYALQVAGPVDFLAITHTDRLPLLNRRICDAYIDRSTGIFPTEDGLIRHQGRVPAIALPSAGDADRLQRTTRALGRCEPHIRELPDDSIHTWRQFIQQELNAPIGITSHGPAESDKCLHADSGGVV